MIKRTVSFWFLIGFGILLNIIFLLGQTMALVNYEFTVFLGLQESAHLISDVGVALNRGFGFGDTVFYMPLFIAGITGLLKGKKYGFFTMVGALAITVYWPIVCLSTLYFAKGAPGFHFTAYTSYTITLLLISLYGLWGLWFLYIKMHF
nr:hypothetical protein [Bacteroidota bacterium]